MVDESNDYLLNDADNKDSVLPESLLPEFSNDHVSKADLRNARAAKVHKRENNFDKYVNVRYPEHTQHEGTIAHAIEQITNPTCETCNKHKAALITMIADGSFSAVGALQAKVTELEAKLADSETNRQILLSALRPVEQDRDVWASLAKRDQATIEELGRRSVQAEKDRDDRDEQIAELHRQLTTALDDLHTAAAARHDPYSVGALGDRIRELEAELTTCRELNEQLRANEADQRQGLTLMTKDRDQLQERLNSKQEDVARLEGVCNRYSAQIQHAARSFREIEKALGASPDFWNSTTVYGLRP